MTEFFSKLSITTTGFFVFALIVLAIYYLVPKKAQNLVLLLASYIFCLTWAWNFAIVLLVFSIINYLIALRVDATADRVRNHWLWLGIALNVGILLFYKYFDQGQFYFFKVLFRMGVTPTQMELKILQPIGISFYVLQAISYLVDVHRKQIPANRNFLEVSLYLAYFPKLLAGPIERAQNFFGQLRADKVVDNQLVTESLLRIFVGLSRKILIADTIGPMMPTGVFNNPSAYSFPDMIFWWFVFGIIVYNDFAGYTGIARGISGLFGIQLSPNFEQPMLSTSFLDFWNRWHMTLSNWLRDYIYLPISRAMLRRNPSGRYLPNLILPPIITMIISGLWHGVSLHFVLWGFMNGLLQAWERVGKTFRKTNLRPPTIWTVLLTNVILLLFNAPFQLDIPQTFDFWSGLLRWAPFQTFTVTIVLLKTLFAIGLSFFLDWKHLSTRDELGLLELSKTTQVLLLAAGLFLLFLATRQQVAAPFIYQEF